MIEHFRSAAGVLPDRSKPAEFLQELDRALGIIWSSQAGPLRSVHILEGEPIPQITGLYMLGERPRRDRIESDDGRVDPAGVALQKLSPRNGREECRLSDRTTPVFCQVDQQRKGRNQAPVLGEV
jgi:hypothetical protein